MRGDDERQSGIARLLRQGVFVWALGHAFASAMLLYAIYKPDPAGVKAWAFVMIGLGPVAVAMTYFEARATWLGKDDVEVAAHVSALAIAGSLGLLAWWLY